MSVTAFNRRRRELAAKLKLMEEEKKTAETQDIEPKHEDSPPIQATELDPTQDPEPAQHVEPSGEETTQPSEPSGELQEDEKQANEKHTAKGGRKNGKARKTKADFGD